MTKKIVTAVCALALGFAWTIAPAIAADESVKDKAKDKMDTAKDKVGNAWDKTKEKTGEVKDKIKEKVTGKKGDDDVSKAQQALTDKGFNPGPIDGKMGPKTKAAITEFQTKENLKTTGRLDKETKAKLMTASASKADTAAPAASPSTTTPTDTTAPATGAAPTSPSSGQSTTTEKK